MMGLVEEIGGMGSATMTELQGSQGAEKHTVLILRQVYLIICFPHSRRKKIESITIV